jgi:hypothetical protein
MLQLVSTAATADDRRLWLLAARGQTLLLGEKKLSTTSELAVG